MEDGGRSLKERLLEERLLEEKLPEDGLLCCWICLWSQFRQFNCPQPSARLNKI